MCRRVSDGKSDQWFTVLPESDLFVLQSVSCIPDFIGLSHDSLFSSDDRKHVLVHAENSANVFDPTWNVEELRQYERDIEWDPSHDPIKYPPRNLSSTAHSKDRFDVYDSLLQASMNLIARGGSKLWLIDSRLRRKQTVISSDTMPILGSWTYSGQGQKMFRGNGCKFYAISDYDTLEVCGDDGDGYEIAAQVCLFVEELAFVAKFQHALLRGIDPSDRYLEQLGILVRERDWIGGQIAILSDQQQDTKDIITDGSFKGIIIDDGRHRKTNISHLAICDMNNDRLSIIKHEIWDLPQHELRHPTVRVSSYIEIREVGVSISVLFNFCSLEFQKSHRRQEMIDSFAELEHCDVVVIYYFMTDIAIRVKVQRLMILVAIRCRKHTPNVEKLAVSLRVAPSGIQQIINPIFIFPSTLQPTRL
ncbi:hypothetical protein BDP55DRAFT_637636 [Colletotrichum godetiae]|uniref:Uncharacterized protein n=1 Tax=Colletotrichum godetiae TaxID=1209918 RepID=A0AAJ0A8Z1_9PEZI|nr:uncharacterized protein BDP55DRAFT_637636 [Colletotrichum godetiae]KAK1658677.1 hypothetical protein BDP55DRAFT_637636 [Colletotrichum godetiae]